MRSLDIHRHGTAGRVIAEPSVAQSIETSGDLIPNRNLLAIGDFDHRMVGVVNQDAKHAFRSIERYHGSTHFAPRQGSTTLHSITRQNSYRAIIRRSEFDPEHPDLGTEIIGLKAPNASTAFQAAHEVTGAKVVVVYQQRQGAQ